MGNDAPPTLQDARDGGLRDRPRRRGGDAALGRRRGTEQESVRDDRGHRDEDVDTVVDEEVDPEIEADRRLVLAVAAEADVRSWDPGGLEEAVRIEPRP